MEPQRRDPNAWLSMQRVVIDWGFPMSQLSVAQALVAHGVEHWWLDGDRDAAHQSFLSREDHPATEESWRVQIRCIEKHWEAVAALFSGRIIDVISAGPTYLSNEERLAEMQRRGLQIDDARWPFGGSIQDPRWGSGAK